MAKKTDIVEHVEDIAPTTESTTPTKDEVFSHNPKLDVYYKTSDGVAFFTENAAANHVAVRKLSDSTIKKIVRP